MKAIEHFKIPSPYISSNHLLLSVLHKALRYKLRCSVDHIISKAKLICFRVGSRVGKDIKRSLKGWKFVYNRLSSSFKTNSYLTSTDALKILLWTRKCRFVLRLIKQHSLWSNWIPIEFGFPIGHEWSDINYVHICQCLANCSRQNSSVNKASRVRWLWNLYSVSESYNWIKSRILIGQRSEVFSVELLCVDLKTGVEESEWTQLLFIENTLLPTSLYWSLSFCLVFAS